MIKLLSDHDALPTMRELLKDDTKKPTVKRQYAAAKVNRLNSDWISYSTTANWEIRHSLMALRARARQQARDNGHFKKFLSMVRKNVIGRQGIQFQGTARMMDGSLNTELNNTVKKAFREWGYKENCTVTGKLNWVEAQKLCVTQLARDGECLIQHVPANNAFGYALKFINVDYLDEQLNVNLPNGNRIIMSVEVDPDDKPVAYWLTTPASELHPAETAKNRVRVPAEEITHIFLVYDDETQTRGVTWFHAAMLDGKNLAGYKEGVILSARMAANQVGFIEQAEPDEESYEGEEDDEGQKKDLHIDMRPLQINLLEAGMKFNQFDPKQPTQNHPAFYKSIFIGLAAALDVPYFSLSGDMESVNYSSARVGLDEERDIWRGLQDFVAEHLCREVFHRWLLSSMLSGMLRLSKKDYIECLNPNWRGRGWQYIDPQKEIDATVTGLENNLVTLTDALAERGIDIVDHFEKIQAERQLAKKYDLDLNYVTKTTATENEPPAGDAGDGKTPPPNKSGDRGFYIDDETTN